HAEHRPSIEVQSSDLRLPLVFVTNSFAFTLPHAMVAAPMRTRFDQFGKQMVRTALETRGPIETDAEAPADTRRSGPWFMPDPACGSMPDPLGLLGRIAAGPSTLEFFHDTPSGDELAGCLLCRMRHNRHYADRRIMPTSCTGSTVIPVGHA